MSLGYITANLPSRGRLYGDKFPTGQVEIRRMTVGEEVILQTTTEGPARVSALLAACCRFPEGFDQSQLIVGDRDALLLAIRVFTFGAKYAFTAKCGACGHGYRANTDLTADIKSVTIDESLTEPIVIPLADSGVRAGFRLLRGKDEEQMIREVKKPTASTSPYSSWHCSLRRWTTSPLASTSGSSSSKNCRWPTRIPARKSWRVRRPA